MFEQIINVDRMEQTVGLFGNFDENIKVLENEFSVTVVNRGTDIKVTGEPENVGKAVRAIGGLLALINKGEPINDQNIHYIISLVNEGSDDKITALAGSDCICITSKVNLYALKH